MRQAVETARRGGTVRTPLAVNLPDGRRHFTFSLRPERDAQGQLIGLVPEAVERPAAD